jgi:hypothetical protein
MVIIDEQVMKSAGDKTETLTHKPVLFTINDDGTRDYALEKDALSSDGKPYVGPLEFVQQVNLREIAGNKAFEYLQGKRYYDLTGKPEETERNGSGSSFNVVKWALLACMIVGLVVIVSMQFIR